jgi:hypothetical protein
VGLRGVRVGRTASIADRIDGRGDACLVAPLLRFGDSVAARLDTGIVGLQLTIEGLGQSRRQLWIKTVVPLGVPFRSTLEGLVRHLAIAGLPLLKAAVR